VTQIGFLVPMQQRLQSPTATQHIAIARPQLCLPYLGVSVHNSTRCNILAPSSY